jgi:hypothetical protein
MYHHFLAASLYSIYGGYSLQLDLMMMLSHHSIHDLFMWKEVGDT